MARAKTGLVAERRADPMRYAQCRSLGHEWRHKGTVGAEDGWRVPFGMAFGTVGLRSQCVDCKTDRVKWVTRSGEVMTRYHHPDGYSLHGDDRLSSQQWRQTFVVTIFDQAPTQPNNKRKSA